jgi:nanoRNase/pAp phosphatase (c-di-AMP/oligoRNAs hydrolase)
MDGLVCAVLFKELEMIDEIVFVHPKDMQDGKIEITSNDITTNLPYVEGVHLAFDHHLSETMRNEKQGNHIIDPDAPSAANVVYHYYGGKEKFPNVAEDMMQAVDKADSAQFSKEDILNPQGWELLNFIMDPRTGLGRFRDFRVSNYDLMMQLIDACRDHNDINQILQLHDVKERTDILFKYQEEFTAQLQKCSTVHNNLVVLDLREEEIIYPGNRFMLYALFPNTNISIHVLWGLKQQNTVFAVGKSIFNRTSNTNVGELLLGYNGGGHSAAGTCQVDNTQVDTVLDELIRKINQDG